MNPPIEVIYIEEGAQASPLCQEVLRRLEGIPTVVLRDAEDVHQEIRRSAADVFGEGKKRLLLTRFKGSFLKKCPGLSPGMVCCNYYVVNLIKNCIYDCSYCFLQDFLSNNPLLTAYVNVEDLIRELAETFRAHPGRTFRVGTGELTDSLALEEWLPYADHLIPFFHDFPNAALELKTKSDCVESLLQHPAKPNIIISWSLNPESFAAAEEFGAPGTRQRLDAARRCHEAGYRVGFHFDPILLFPGWETAYAELVDDLFAHVPAAGIEWVSLGSFRYRRSLKPIIRQRHPATRLFASEHVPAGDGKFRYLRPLRQQAYDAVRDRLQCHAPDLNIYLCMESKEVWENVTGRMPRADAKLDAFFSL
ncbi:MAG: radical SAM protein [Nitrospinaceae bacterium]